MLAAREVDTVSAVARGDGVDQLVLVASDVEAVFSAPARRDVRELVLRPFGDVDAVLRAVPNHESSETVPTNAAHREAVHATDDRPVHDTRLLPDHHDALRHPTVEIGVGARHGVAAEIQASPFDDEGGCGATVAVAGAHVGGEGDRLPLADRRPTRNLADRRAWREPAGQQNCQDSLSHVHLPDDEWHVSPPIVHPCRHGVRAVCPRDPHVRAHVCHPARGVRRLVLRRERRDVARGADLLVPAQCQLPNGRCP
jgi:hypothetical protein